MKKIVFCVLLVLSCCMAESQKIVSVVYVGKDGITQNPKEANAFILIKKFNDTVYQRLNYNAHAPLESVQTYNSAELNILQGPFFAYKKNGLLNVSGHYYNNKKDAEWLYYDDTFKIIKKEIYQNGELIKTVDPDTTKKVIVTTEPSKDELEAEFPGGQKNWVKFLVKNLNADLGTRSVKGGTVLVGFTVTKTGKVIDIFLRKSVEYILDEEAKRVISKSPDWKPAWQFGKNVNAYRVQPITFSVN